MKAEIERALADQLLAMADDEMILAHRNSEWTGHGPILEEDIAFTNIALDEMGHAAIWYRLLASLLGEDPETYPDWLVFFRDAAGFRNVQMVELPKGDWGFSMLRQYLFDAAELARLPLLTKSDYSPIAEAAAKILPEERYHHRHTEAWVRRLGLGTEESHERMQRALDELWPYALQLFSPLPGEAWLVDCGVLPAADGIRSRWLASVRSHLVESMLEMPEGDVWPVEGREQHTHHLEPLVAELQVVARNEPEAEW